MKPTDRLIYPAVSKKHCSEIRYFPDSIHMLPLKLLFLLIAALHSLAILENNHRDSSQSLLEATLHATKTPIELFKSKSKRDLTAARIKVKALECVYKLALFCMVWERFHRRRNSLSEREWRETGQWLRWIYDFRIEDYIKSLRAAPK